MKFATNERSTSEKSSLPLSALVAGFCSGIRFDGVTHVRSECDETQNLMTVFTGNSIQTSVLTADTGSFNNKQDKVHILSVSDEGKVSVAGDKEGREIAIIINDLDNIKTFAGDVHKDTDKTPAKNVQKIGFSVSGDVHLTSLMDSEPNQLVHKTTGVSATSEVKTKKTD